MYYISFSTIPDKRSDFSYKKKKKYVLYRAVAFGAHLILLFRMTSTTVRVIFDVTKSGKIKVKS